MNSWPFQSKICGKSEGKVSILFSVQKLHSSREIDLAMVVCTMNGAVAVAWGGNRRGCSTLLTIAFFLQLILASSYTVFSRPISHPVSSLQRPSLSKLKDIGGELGFSSSEHGSKPLKGVVAFSPMQFHIQEEFSLWPCGDQLDKNIFKLLFPAILNFAIVPLVGAADTFWVGRMRNALALAGQGAANQLFNSAFWFFSFLPSVVTPLIAKARGADDETALQQRIAEAFFVATVTGILGTLLLTVNPAWVLSLVLKSDSSARVFAEPYLLLRGLTGIIIVILVSCCPNCMDLSFSNTSSLINGGICRFPRNNGCCHAPKDFFDRQYGEYIT